MFERFTERARQVVVLAADEARLLKHDYLGTEHILLGLVRDTEGAAVRILLDFDADAEKIRNEVIRTLSGPGGRHESAERQRPLLTRPSSRPRGARGWIQWQSMIVGASSWASAS